MNNARTRAASSIITTRKNIGGPSGNLSPFSMASRGGPSKRRPKEASSLSGITATIKRSMILDIFLGYSNCVTRRGRICLCVPRISKRSFLFCFVGFHFEEPWHSMMYVLNVVCCPSLLKFNHIISWNKKYRPRHPMMEKPFSPTFTRITPTMKHLQ